MCMSESSVRVRPDTLKHSETSEYVIEPSTVGPSPIVSTPTRLRPAMSSHDFYHCCSKCRAMFGCNLDLTQQGITRCMCRYGRCGFVCPGCALKGESTQHLKHSEKVYVLKNAYQSSNEMKPRQRESRSFSP